MSKSKALSINELATRHPAAFKSWIVNMCNLLGSLPFEDVAEMVTFDQFYESDDRLEMTSADNQFFYWSEEDGGWV